MRIAWLLIAASAGLAGTSPETCAPCHRAETQDFGRAGMTLALTSGIQSEILKANPRLAASIGAYRYEMSRTETEVDYIVTDGKEAMHIPIEWAFGLGSAGQTYLFQREGRWYESRVSYFGALRGLDLTMGAQSVTPRNLVEAAGRPAPAVEVGKCFDCHATHVVRRPEPILTALTPGVQCERCHGPAQAHLTNASKPLTPNLAAFKAEEMSNFCGQCHRTWADIAANGPRGIQNIRFQPYRLGNSKCYDAADGRIRCTSCHNPHRGVETSAAAYDAKCLACHAPAAARVTKASAHICRVAAAGCVTCHMPKLELPGAHKKFTDHLIRVVKANEAYPE